MRHPDSLRRQARELRVSQRLTVDEIARRLAVSRSTVQRWVRDLPIPRSRLASDAVQAELGRLRAAAYEEGRRTFDVLARDPTFRDFVTLYVAAGYRRSRNLVSLGNADPAVVALADRWLRRLARAGVDYGLRCRSEEDLARVRRFWGSTLRVPPDVIHLDPDVAEADPTWRERHGVLAVHCRDTLLRARLDGWMDRLREQWLDSAGSGA